MPMILLIVIIGAAAGFLATQFMRVQAAMPTTIAIGVVGSVIGWLVLRVLVAITGGGGDVCRCGPWRGFAALVAAALQIALMFRQIARWLFVVLHKVQRCLVRHRGGAFEIANQLPILHR